MIKKNNILHISHTDILQDNRILKSMESLHNLKNTDVQGIGIYNGYSLRTIKCDFQISSLRLFSNKTKWSPKSIRLILTFIEFLFHVLFKTIKTKPNILHCHDTIGLVVGYICSFFSNSLIVYDAHELESNRNEITKLKSFLTKSFEFIAWNKISLFITVSPSIKNWYLKKYGPKTSIVIMNSPKSEKIKYNDYYNLKLLHNIPQGSLLFLYLGGFTKGRGIEMLLEAFSNHNVNSHIVFTGYGPLKNLIEIKAHTYSNIHINDPVPHDKVVNLTSSADIGICLIENVSLSDYYCLPNKLFEYAFAGIPVLASNFPDIKKLVKHYELGEVCDLSIQDITKKIISFELSNLKPLSIDLFDISASAQTIKLQSAYKRVFKI